MAAVSPVVALPPRALAGKTCVITGASRGIGLETARGLGRLGARLVLVCRDRGRGEAAVAAVRAAAPDAPAAELVLADLAVLADVRRAAAEVAARCPRIDVLLNNAGLAYMQRRITPDGLEATFAVNHLAPFLFTTLLLERVRAAAPARVITVSSMLHTRGRIDFGDLQSERSYSGLGAYSNTKLGNVLFTRELAGRLAGSGVTANCLHPGGVASEIGMDNPWWARVALRLVRPFLLTPEQGAQTSIWLAAAPEVAGVSGKYFVKCAEAAPAERALDAAAGRRLWEESERLVSRAGGS
ncbi:MAG: SDR family oxidoreductase [Planctomycetes bacterium]|nr:SDR family oxidoreductase [Planctomycetota bacterium]